MPTPTHGADSSRVSRNWLWLLLPIFVLALWFAWWRLAAIPMTTQTLKALHASAPSNTASAPAAQTAEPIPTMTDLGLAGDMFGGLNALFAGLAFAGVAIAAWFQHTAHLKQDEQLRIARDQQRLAEFEPLFFQLLEVFRELRKDAKLTFEAHALGMATFSLDSAETQSMVREMTAPAIRGDAVDKEGSLLWVKESYRRLYDSNEHVLGPLFRTLYHVFRLIEKSGLPEHQQVRYANIARGLLGGDFLNLLMINCCSKQGAGATPYVELFGLLKHRRRSSTDSVDDEFARRYFAPTAVMSYVDRLEYWQKHARPTLPL